MSTRASSAARDYSPEEGHDGQQTSGPRKRRRKALSCNDCRRRKLRCDREYPACGRCRAAGHASSCTYDSVPVNSSNTSSAYQQTHNAHVNGLSVYDGNGNGYEPRGISTPGKSPHDIVPGAISNSIQNQKKKLAELESKVASLEATNPSGPYGPDLDLRSARDSEDQSKRRLERSDGVEAKFFRGKGFRTQFYGATNPTSIISFFPEVSSYLKNISLTDSSFKSIHGKFKPLKMQQKRQRLEALAVHGTKISNLLPTRERCDYLMRLYFDTYENTFRILHGPSFWRDYKLFWLNPPDDKQEFVAILLTAMSCVRCLEPPERLSYVADCSMNRLCVMKWLQAVESWLQQQSQKHLTLANYQIRCLILLSKIINIIKRKRLWTEAGNLLRFSMSAGLHRDPKSLGLIASPFVQEMRRRLWATMVELELQISINRGMPAAIAGVKCDCEVPLNVDDELFDESSEELPASKDPKTWTQATYLNLSRQSLPLRVSLTSIINDPTAQLSFRDVLYYEQLINEHIAAIPRWSEQSLTDKDQDDLNTVLPQALLDLQLRQFLILIHNPIARHLGKEAQISQSNYSRMVCYNTSMAIFDLHERLIRRGSQALNLLRSDVYLASLTTSHMVYMAHQTYLTSPISGDMLLRTFESTYHQCVSAGLRIIEHKILLLGEGFMTYGMMASAYSIVQSLRAPSQADEYKKQMMDDIMRLYDRLISLQESPPYSMGTPQSLQDQPQQSIGDILANTSSEPRGPAPALPTAAGFELAPNMDNSAFGFGNGNMENYWMLDDMWTFNFLDP